MTITDLTANHRHKLLMAVVDRRDYFHRVHERMDANGWDRSDPVYVAIVNAYDAAHAAVVAIHDAGKVTGKIGGEPPQWRNAMGAE